MTIVWTALAIGLCFTAALAFRKALQWSRWSLALAWLAATIVTAWAPCLVPLAAKPARFLVALVAVAMLTKLYDLFRQHSLSQALTLPEYATYLTNWFWLVLRRSPPAIARADDWKRLKWPAALSIFTACLSYDLFRNNVAAISFDNEHVLKVTIVVMLTAFLANLGAIIWRLNGGLAWDPMLNPALACTPADFWRRWNVPAQHFFHEYVFLPAGGRRNPVRATLLTFVISGLIHEYVFGIATGRLQGWQLLFFSIQGVATVITSRWRARGWLCFPLFIGTLAFNLATSTLFFISVNEVVPFYIPRRTSL